MDQEIFEDEKEHLEIIEEIREKNESLDTNPFDNSDRKISLKLLKYSPLVRVFNLEFYF